MPKQSKHLEKGLLASFAKEIVAGRVVLYVCLKFSKVCDLSNALKNTLEKAGYRLDHDLY